MLLSAFTVVLGTLVVQGLTLKPLLGWLRLGRDATVGQEVSLARTKALEAVLAALQGEDDETAARLREEYAAKLAKAAAGHDPHGSLDASLRRSVVPHARHAIDLLRAKGRISDDAYRQVEQELDWLELSTGGELPGHGSP